MRTKNGKSITNLDQFNLWSYWFRPDVSCNDVYKFKLQFGKTEEIIIHMLQYYLGKSSDLDIYWCAKYRGQNGCNQELDITVEHNNQILYGLSIKSGFSAYLEPNDLTINLLLQYKEEITKYEPKASVNGVLQDMARIRNIKEAESVNAFNSVTILFDKPHQHKWIDRMKRQFDDHDYVFLKDNSKNFFEELERINPEIRKYREIPM